MSRVIASMGGEGRRALDIDHGGAAFYLTALATRTGQSRVAAVLSTNHEQTARLALGLRGAGLDSAEVERQVLRIDPKAVPPREIAEMPPEAARQILSESANAGVV